MSGYRSRRPDWSVAAPPHSAEPDVFNQLANPEHECRSNLALPMAPWLLARAVRRTWRRIAGRRR